MSDFTAKEVEEKIEAVIDDWYDIENLEGWGDRENETLEVEGLGTIEFVESFGGEGQGDSLWVVFKIGDRYFQKDGYYASYDGGTWDGAVTEVKPVTVERIEYQPIDKA